MATFTRIAPPPANAPQQSTEAKQTPGSPSLQTLQAQLQSSPAVQAQKRLAEQLSTATTTQRQPLAAAGSAPVDSSSPVQRVLDEEVKVNQFGKDVGSNTDQKDVKEALQKVLDAAGRTPIQIKYATLVSEVQSIANNADKLKKYAKRLETQKGKELDKELSGDKGHMLDRHVLVDSEFQEERLENQGIEKATRLDIKNKKNYEAYMVFVKILEVTVPKLVKTHIDNVSYNLLASMQEQGGDFALANNDGARRTALQAALASSDLTDDAQAYSLAYTWNIAVTGGGNVTLTCTPELTSNEKFKKIVTEKVKEQVVESQKYAPLKMYWGSNKFKLSGITAATTFEELAELVNELDYKLGVTMF